MTAPAHGAAEWMAAEIRRLQARLAELEAERQPTKPDLQPLHASPPRGLTAEAADLLRALT